MSLCSQVLRRFWARQEGSISLFFVLLIPALLLAGGVGIDITQMNAQRRQVQGQADLAALAAAAMLPDRAQAQTAAVAAMRSNTFCEDGIGEWGCKGDAAPSFVWFSQVGDRFVDVSGTNEVANAVDVVVRAKYRPWVIGAFISAENLQLTATARGQRFATVGGVATYRIYNNLLRINLNHSILDHLLEPLGVKLSADVLGAGGLASARVKLDDLLHLASGGVGLQVLGFDDVLRASIPIEKLLGLALNGKSGEEPWVEPLNPARPVVPGSVTLEEILSMSPELIGVRAGDILPDIELGLLDLLTATAQLKSGSPRIDLLKQRLGLGASLKVLDPRIGDIGLSLGLIREGITTVAVADPDPIEAQAKLTQGDIHLKVSLLEVLRLDLTLELVGAEASLLELNCQAKEGTDEILAVFEVVPYPAAIDLSVNLLNANAKFDAPKPPTAESIRLLTDLTPQRVAFTREAYDAYLAGGPPLSYSVKAALDLSGLGDVVKQLIGNIQIGPTIGNGESCGWNILQCIINGVGELVGSIVGVVAGLLSNVLRLDLLLNKILELLGIELIPVDLVLDSVSCRAPNVGPAALIR